MQVHRRCCPKLATAVLVSSVLAAAPTQALSGLAALPPKIRTYAALQKRMAEIEQRYKPFTRNLVPGLGVRQRLMLSQSAWRFRLDEEDVGTAERWFAPELDDADWTDQSVPDYREFVRGWYRRAFEVPEAWGDRKVFLRFRGVDYGATVWLNGRELGRHTGYFGHFGFDVTDVVKLGGRNVLAVRVFNPFDSGRAPDSINGKGMGTVTLSTQNGFLQHGNGAGILDDVYLEAVSRTRIESVHAAPALPDLATVEATVVGDAPFVGELSVSVLPRNFDGPTAKTELNVRSQADDAQRVQCELRIAGPRLWTPDQPFLYTIRTTLADSSGRLIDSDDVPFGLRTIERAGDGAIIFNGHKRVLRGACSFGNFWMPTIQKDERQIVRDILLWKAANLEVARITVYVLPKFFYQYADMYGLMLYADTPLQWGYPREGKTGNVKPEFAAEAKKQIGEMVALLRNHPSVVIYEGMNEFFPTPMPFGREVFDLFKQLDPSRVVAVNSGARRPGCGMSDRHIYSGWYGAVARTTDVTPGHENALANYPFASTDKGFVSEYGNVALPDWETWRKCFSFAPTTPAEPWDIRKIPNEQCYRGNSLGDRVQLGQLMWRSGKWHTAADWISRSQEQQTDFTKTLTEVWRRRRDTVAGYFYFHLIDPGPLAWPKAIVDCDRRPKPAYYALMHASRSLRVNIDSDRARFHGAEPIDGFSVWIYNDTASDFTGTLRAFVVDDARNVLAAKQLPAKAGVYESVRLPQFTFAAPTVREDRRMRIVAVLVRADGNVADWDETGIKVFAPRLGPADTPRVVLHDPVDRTAPALDALRVPYRDQPDLAAADLSQADVLVIGELAAHAQLAAVKEKLKAFAERGGTVLVLNQHPAARGAKQRPVPGSVVHRARAVKDLRATDLAWLPVKAALNSTKYVPSDYVQIDPFWDVFAGLGDADFRCWNDLEGILCDWPLRPTEGWTSLATCGPSQAYSALSVAPIGKGRLALSQLLLVERVPQDPVATRVLTNLLRPEAYVARLAPSISKSADLTSGGISVRLVVRNDGRERMKARVVDAQPEGLTAERKLEWVIDVPSRGQREIVYDLRAEELIRGIVNLDKAVLFCEGRAAVSSQVSVFPALPSTALAKFDFGSDDSPCVEGFTRVTCASRFSESQGHGWQHTDGLNWRNRLAPNRLMRDFVFSAKDRVFSIVLPNGRYLATLFIGDNDFPLHPIDVFAENVQVVKGLTTAPAEFVSPTFTAAVTDRRLDLRFHNQHTGQNWEIAAIVIEEDNPKPKE